ncbi:hypothetical protein PVAP13_6NG198200, partial [Panicum virgatum]
MASSLPRPATRTASRCTPRTARGTQAFEIAAYSLHRGLGVGNFIRSAAFDVGGYSWCIRFYHDGYNNGEEDSRDDGDGNVAAFLELLIEDAEVRALYDFRLLDRSTGTSSSVFSTAAPQVFDTLDVREDNYFAWGTDELMERSELEEASAYLVDDSLVIECDVTVIMEPQVENTMAASDVEVPPSDLSSSLGKLLEMEERADVIFKVEDEVFHAHKVVLAVRSPIFLAEPDEGLDMEPAVFKALLHFIYTDTLPAMEGLDGDEKSETVWQLLVAEDRYAMSTLKLICEGILSKSLDAANMETML